MGISAGCLEKFVNDINERFFENYVGEKLPRHGYGARKPRS